jgi:hypothetical protein
MRNLVLVLVIFVSVSSFMSFSEIKSDNINNNSIEISDYCDGWEDGYCEGWRDVKGTYAICPITPICPIPEIGKDGYRGGYNRAFKAGMRAARKN